MSVVVVDPATGLQYFTVGSAPFSPSIREVAGEISWLEILNESPYLLFAQMGSLIIPIPAWYGYPIQSPDGGGFNLPLSLSPLLLGTTANAPSSSCVVTVYGVGERPAQQQPYPLVRQANIGNNVAVSSINSLKNDGNAAGTQIIEATPTSQGVSSWSFNNDASGFLQVLSANVLRKILNVVRGDAVATKAVVQLGDSGDPSVTTLYGNLDRIRSDAGAIVSDGAGDLTVPLVQTNGTDLQCNIPDASKWIFWQHNITPTGKYAVNGIANRIIFDNSGTLFYQSAPSGVAGNAPVWTTQWQISATGMIAMVAGQATAGSFGVAPIVAQLVQQAITTTAVQTFTILTVPATGFYRVNAAYYINNGTTPTTFTLSCIYTGGNSGIANTQFFLNENGVPINAISRGNGDFATFPLTIYAQTGTALNVRFIDAAGTPNDKLNVSIERLA